MRFHCPRCLERIFQPKNLTQELSTLKTLTFSRSLSQGTHLVLSPKEIKIFIDMT